MTSIRGLRARRRLLPEWEREWRLSYFEEMGNPFELEAARAGRAAEHLRERRELGFLRSSIFVLLFYLFAAAILAVPAATRQTAWQLVGAAGILGCAATLRSFTGWVRRRRAHTVPLSLRGVAALGGFGALPAEAARSLGRGASQHRHLDEYSAELGCDLVQERRHLEHAYRAWLDNELKSPDEIDIYRALLDEFGGTLTELTDASRNLAN